MSLLFLSFAFLASLEPSSEEVRKLLEYQYQQKILTIQKENELLRQKLAESESRRRAALRKTAEKIKHLQTQIQELEKPAESPYDPSLPRSPQEIYQLGLTAVGSEDWNNALLHFEEIVQKYPQSELADNAIYWMAKIFLHKKEMALATAELHRLISNYPKSDRLLLAKRQLEQLESSQRNSNR